MEGVADSVILVSVGSSRSRSGCFPCALVGPNPVTRPLTGGALLPLLKEESYAARSVDSTRTWHSPDKTRVPHHAGPHRRDAHTAAGGGPAGCVEHRRVDRSVGDAAGVGS